MDRGVDAFLIAARVRNCVDAIVAGDTPLADLLAHLVAEGHADAVAEAFTARLLHMEAGPRRRLVSFLDNLAARAVELAELPRPFDGSDLPSFLRRQAV